MFMKFLVLLFFGIIAFAVVAIPMWLVYMAADIYYNQRDISDEDPQV